MPRELNARLIKIENITIPENFSLRDVNKDSEKFKDMVASIYKYGVFQTISVVPKPDGEGYILDDGKHRLIASMEAKELAKQNKDKAALERVSLIPAIIEDCPISEIPFRQIVANLHRIETSPREFARQIKRIWAQPQYAHMSKSDLFAALGIKKSPSWIENQLNVGNLIPELGTLVDEGKIPITAAYHLGRLPAEYQIDWLEKAQTTKVEDIILGVNEQLGRIKEEKTGIKKETDPLADIFPRKKKEFKEKISQLTAEVDKRPDDKYLVAYFQGVLWGCQLDNETREAKIAKKAKEDEERQAIIKLKREKLLAIQKAARPQIEAEIRKELGLN